MNDLEQQLRELLDTKARDAEIAPKPPPGVLTRARRHQVMTVLTAIVGTAAVVLGSIAGLQTLIRTGPPSRPADVPVLPDAPAGFRSVVLPHAAIAYPDAWFLVALDPVASDGRVLQLTNFDAGAARVDCDGGGVLPPGGVLLEIQGGAGMDALPSWPTSLGVVPGPGGPCGADGILAASWTTDSGATFSATGLLSRDASQDDRDLLVQTYGTLEFPAAAPQTEKFLGDANLILDSMDTPVGPVALYAYEEPCDEGSDRWVGIAGPAGSGLSGASGCSQNGVPIADESVTMNLDEWGGVVWGEVAATVARAELRTVEGQTFPAELLPLPPSFGVEGQQIVWGVVEGRTADRVTTLLYDAEGNLLNEHAVLSRTTVATGTDPEGGPWELYLDVTTEGTGLGFQFETGGGGGGCCLRPLEGEFRLDGWGTGGGEPSNITALASENVARVVFEPVEGEQVEGQVFPVPDESLGIPKVALVLVPEDVRLEGDLVAYDEEGNEIGREFVGDLGEPPGPTAEIDATWNLLRQARDAIALWAADHGESLADLTAEEANASMPEVPWNPSGQGKPVPGEVSIRGVARAGGSELTGRSGWTLVLVSATAGPDGATGSTYCVAVNIDENGGGNFRYGTQDAASYEECRGGWPELEP